MSISHIVLFKYGEGVSHTEKHLIGSKFLALLDTCQLDGKPYILSVTGGANNSKEGANKGLEHAFILTFASLEHRDYYVDKCPAHQAFKESLAGKVTDACVVDFAGGVF